MRAAQWRAYLCPSSPYPPLHLKHGCYDIQIRLDIDRTYPSEKWFEDHKETLVDILNTFSVVNEAFGYPQGLNFLTFPLYYVYFRDNPKTAVEDTFYSLQSLVRIVLPVYPTDAKDKKSWECIQAVTNIISLKCVEKVPKLSMLFSPTHKPFLQSIVCTMIPTLYSNVFSLKDTLILWDMLFEKKGHRLIFETVLNIMVEAILFHKNMFLHLPVDKCMQMFPTVLKESIAVCSFV
jgi:hypothetical protein